VGGEGDPGAFEGGGRSQWGKLGGRHQRGRDFGESPGSHEILKMGREGMTRKQAISTSRVMTGPKEV